MCARWTRRTFEKGYRAFLDEAVKPLQKGKPAEKKQTLAELKAAYEKNDDLEAAAELAVRYLERDRVQARKLAEKVLDRKRNHPKATYVLARLERLAGNVKRERTLLEDALRKDDPDPRVLLALGKIYYDAKEFDKAEEMFERGRKAEPFEPSWLMQLARVYAQKDDKAGAYRRAQGVGARPTRTSWSSGCVWLDCCWRADRPQQPRRMHGRRWRSTCAARKDATLLLKALTEQKKDEEATKIRELLEK